MISMRQRLDQQCEQASPSRGCVEVEESYFGVRRLRAKRSRGASGKTMVFGLLSVRIGAILRSFPMPAPLCVQDVICGRIEPQSVINSDGWLGYDGLVDIGFDKLFRLHHGVNEFAVDERHINGFESFWSYAKRRLAKFPSSMELPEGTSTSLRELAL